jgi:MOSC domain-containing protein YiiM
VTTPWAGLRHHVGHMETTQAEVLDAAAPTPRAEVTTEELEAALGWVRASPPEHGRVELVVRRPTVESREVLAEAELTPEEGLAGDNWRDRRSSSAPDAPPDPERQLTLMNARIAGLVAREPDRRALAGDQLYVDFDLSIESAPAGTRLRVGTAVVELTEPPHLGCAKFVSRFGEEAMRFVNSSVGRSLRLRGANARVLVAGTVRPGDAVVKLKPPEEAEEPD